MFALHQIRATIAPHNHIDAAIGMVATLRLYFKTMTAKQLGHEGFKILPSQGLKALAALSLHAPEHAVTAPALPHTQHTKHQYQHGPSKLQHKRHPSGRHAQASAQHILLHHG